MPSTLLSLALLASSGVPGSEAVLPPLRPWSGASQRLVVPPDDPWVTPAEQSRFERSPSLEEIDRWYARLAGEHPQVRLLTIGTSEEGRPIRMIVVSREGASTPDELRANGRPTLLAQGGIHAGEIDGSDAGMMLIRDLTARGTESALLDRANFLLIPVLNVDGHARATPYSRINQRGPAEQGWRTNAQNLNLNRDYAKADTRGIQAVLDVLREWQPDFYADLHVTDGSDYQYDITWGWNGPHAWSPSIASWIESSLAPALDGALTRAGHSPGRLVFEIDGRYPEQGLLEWTALPRFSHGYGDARHLPSILVENHSLKPFRRRVLGTYVLLRALLDHLGTNAGALSAAVERDRGSRPSPVPLEWTSDPEDSSRTIFHAYETRTRLSPITGAAVVEYLEQPKDWDVPLIRQTKAAAVAGRPAAYWIPAAWGDVIERLRAHGIRMEEIASPCEIEVDMYRLIDPKLSTNAFEGHVLLEADTALERRVETFPTGSVRIPTDQPLGTVAMLLLEPGSPDSFLRWGFFASILSRTEYTEAYVMEPMAQRMLADDPDLAAEFERALREDAELAASPQRRLEWFYRRTPYWDDRWRLYPVAREERKR